MKRGDVVICAGYRDYGKFRPAVVVQADIFNQDPPSVTVCLFTTEIRDAGLFRLDIYPNPENGLQVLSQIMVDKISTLKADWVKEVIGHLQEWQIDNLNASIQLWLDL